MDKKLLIPTLYDQLQKKLDVQLLSKSNFKPLIFPKFSAR